jgi:hypothetical protein
MHPWPGFIRALMYPIIFEANPADGIGRVIETVVDREKSGTQDDFLWAIGEALASGDDLGQLLPQPHPNHIIRAFLAELASTLRSRAAVVTSKVGNDMDNETLRRYELALTPHAPRRSVEEQGV